jgi:glycosyltransferase involved in cell wall biosynthesis
MRIVQVTTVASATGAIERHVLGLTEKAVAAGHDVCVLCPRGSLVAAARRLGADVRILPLRGYWDVASYLRASRVLAGFRPRIVHVHDPRSLLIAYVASRLAGASVLMTDHNSSEAKTASGYFEQQRGWRPVQPGLRHLLKRVDAVIATSHTCRRDLLARFGLDPGRVRVVYCGVPELQSVPPVRRRVVVVARLSHEKGIDVLIDAMRELEGVRLVIAGDGPARKDIEAQVRRTGIGDRVEFLGWVHDPSPLIASAEVICLPSRWDNAPLVAMEAMLAGHVVVASNVGALGELITHMRDGLLVPPEQPGALAGALRLVLTDEHLRLRLGASARARASDLFSIESSWKNHAAVYALVA